MRHSHKGRLSRRESLKSVPFVYMNKEEFQDRLDEAGRNLTAGILEEGRTGEVEIVVAALFLESPGRADRLITYAPEFGDGEGKRYIVQFGQSAARLGLLKSDEKLRAEVLHIALERPT